MSGFEVRQRAALKGERGAGKGKRGGCWSNDSCVFLNCKCHYYFFFFYPIFFKSASKCLVCHDPLSQIHSLPMLLFH